MSIKSTIWQDMVQIDNKRLYCIPFSGDNHITRVISKLVLCLLILNDTNLTLILMFVSLIHLQQKIAEACDEAARKYYEGSSQDQATILQGSDLIVYYNCKSQDR
jgi:hypothetical protein